LHDLPHPPTILEVGVDRGVTFLTLVTFLVRTKQEFLAFGVDIMVQEQVQLMLQHIDRSEKQQAFLIENNSLEIMPKMIEQGLKFDLLLIDGDHNYHTVVKEMEHVEALTHPHSVVIIDDYFGRWAKKDLFYKDRPGYEENQFATQKIDTEKHGVQPAVDEWLDSHKEWQKLHPLNGEPVLLIRSNLDQDQIKDA
jgi:hypothetical protein